MASFHQHVAVSTALGVGYGAAAYFGFGIDWATCVVAGGLTGLAGMLPDLDSPRGQPVREVFGFAAAMVPMLLLKRCCCVVALLPDALIEGQRQLTPEALVVAMAACYFAVRLGGARLLDYLTVHRGMFHSIPAALIVALAAFLLCDAPTAALRVFLAGGSLLGFLSHLLMDEIWSVQLGARGVTWKKSAGTAFKLVSHSWPATLTAYATLLVLTYLVARDPDWSGRLNQLQANPSVPQMASEFIERVRR
jgi:hypothetical protein